MKKLIVRNLKEFFANDFNNQFKILADLENEIQESKESKNTILIPYSNNADAIFDLIKIDFAKNCTVYTYHFSNTIS